MATIKQDNKEFFESNGRYYVFRIDGRYPVGRESSYPYIKCSICDKLIGRQFNGYGRHFKKCETKKKQL